MLRCRRSSMPASTSSSASPAVIYPVRLVPFIFAAIPGNMPPGGERVFPRGQRFGCALLCLMRNVVRNPMFRAVYKLKQEAGVESFMNYVTFNEQSMVFTLRTEHTMYQMQVRQFGILCHLYYGPFLGEDELDYRIIELDRGFSPNPYEADRDRTISLDILPQEYSGYGNGDYRVCAAEVDFQDGSAALDLRYQGYEVLKGKYKLPGMPAMFGDDTQAETLEIRLADEYSGANAVLMFGIFPKLDLITRAVRFENLGDRSYRLRKVMSAQLDFLDGPFELIHFHGRHTMERMPERLPLMHGMARFGSRRGTSSHQHNPFAILCRPDTTEERGLCYGLSLVYSGNFLFEAEVDQMNQVRVMMGIHPAHFWQEVQCGDVFYTPEIIMGCSEDGLTGLSHLFHDGMRQNLMRGKYVFSPRPVLINNWEATYFTFDEEKIFSIAEKALDLGVDLFVLDDGWFGKRDSDFSGLGDWTVNEEKIRGGLKNLSERIRSLGLKLGLWIEPEMVSEDSNLYREHPDWCLRVPGRLPVRGRYQLNLDITRQEVRDHVMEQIISLIEECHISYIKWDMNRSLGNVYSSVLIPQKQGEVFHRYVLALYEMQESLITRFPDLLFENCSGGGGRFDAGMLYYSPQIWCSDNTDAVDRLRIQYGTSFGYPITSMGAHVSAVPNHQTGRSVSIRTRSVVASCGTYGFELDPEKMTKEEMQEARKGLEEYKATENLRLCGDFYRLSNPFMNQDFCLWQFVSKEKKETLVEGVILRHQANSPVFYVYLRGLKADARYQRTDTGRVYSGAALMKAGLPLPLELGEYQPVRMIFREIP